MLSEILSKEVGLQWFHHQGSLKLWFAWYYILRSEILGPWHQIQFILLGCFTTYWKRRFYKYLMQNLLQSVDGASWLADNHFLFFTYLHLNLLSILFFFFLRFLLFFSLLLSLLAFHPSFLLHIDFIVVLPILYNYKSFTRLQSPEICLEGCLPSKIKFPKTDVPWPSTSGWSGYILGTSPLTSQAWTFIHVGDWPSQPENHSTLVLFLL